MEKLKNSDLNRLTVTGFKASEKLPVALVLDNVRSAINVGSIFRTADAFRIQKVFCCGITPVPPHRDILKSALGATESVEWQYFADTLSCLHALKEEGFTVAAVEQTVSSLPLYSVNERPEEKTALVFGHEMHGVDQKVIDNCSYSIEVPQAGTKHSLNIAVCAGIVLWEFFRKATVKDPAR